MAEWHLRLAMRSGQIRFRLKLRATSAPSADEHVQRSPHKSNPRSIWTKGRSPRRSSSSNASSVRRPLPEVYFSRVDRTLRMEKLELIRNTPGRAERISLWIRSKAPALSTSTRSM